MALEWLSPVVDGTTGLVSSLFQGFGAKKRQREYLQFQREENKKARDYNFQLAQQQNSWNIEQWQRENEYNDPANQMARLRNAGINPDMFYNQGASGITSAASPQMTAGAPYTPMDYSSILQTPTIGEAAAFGLDNALKSASLRKLLADTKNVDADTGLKGAQKSYYEEGTNKLRSDIELNGANIKLINNNAELSVSQNKKVIKELDNLDAQAAKTWQEVHNLQVTAQNIEVDTWRKIVDYHLNSAAVQAQIDRFAVQNALDKQDLKFKMATFLYDVAAAQSDAEFKMHSARNEALKYTSISLQNQRFQFELDMDKTFGKIERGLGVAQGFVDLIGGIIPGPKMIAQILKGMGKHNRKYRDMYESLSGKKWTDD